MPEATQIVFSFRELSELMVRQAGVTEGIWGIWVRFGIQAVNIGETEEQVHPSAVVPILEIGIQRFEKPSNLTVDASTVSRSPST